MWFVSALVYSLIFFATSSRCPVPKKPHLTSCSIFYNCVNLPSGGYVWVPSKCTEGLVFQPYLRTCVVPGDIWTCDSLSTDSTLVTKKYESPELNDSIESGYAGYTQDPLEFSETIDSSYVISDTTAYSLIEFEEPSETYDNKDIRNISYHEKQNYLYEFIKGQSNSSLPLMQRYKDIINNHYKWLNELISRLHIYRELSAAISNSVPTSILRDTTTNPTQSIKIFATHNQKQNISLNYLVQSYIEESKLHDNDLSEMEENSRPQTDDIINTSTENTLGLLINDLDTNNNIVKINDNLGNKQYFTIERYKVIAHQILPQSVSIVPCTKNVRLPNMTNCNKYYTCDPKTASVMEYSCPLYTAFNMHMRICDIESTKICKNHMLMPKEILANHVENKNTTYSKHVQEKDLCRELGKIKDPISDSHYYICYNIPESEDIQSIRMTCPNSLIFCQGKKVCTTRRLCNVS